MTSVSLRLALLAALLIGITQVTLAQFADKSADLKALPKVPQEFEVTRFASEPLVRQPCSMAFDERGRLFVGMGPQYRNPTPETPGDSVVIVQDTNGDGRADRTQEFATGFNAIQGLAWHGRDLWIANAPDLTVVRDRDDEADEYVKVYTDLGNLEHGLHGLNWAPDGKLYMSKGNSKGLNQPGRYAPKAFRDLWGLKAPADVPEIPAAVTSTKKDYRRAYHDPADDWGLDGGVLRPVGGGCTPFIEGGSSLFRPTDMEFGPDGALWVLGWSSAYLLNETSGRWEPHGVVIGNGFWPMQEPQPMDDGNWIMAGFRVASGFGQAGNLPAVAISKGDDFTKWDLVVIAAAPNLGSNLWGESTVIVESERILNIARYGRKAIALLSVSEDHGRSWTPAAPSNLPMATSKPYAGTLSTGQPYLVCTTTADTGGARSPLTIVVGRPGESVFSKVFLIRTSVFEGTPGVSDPKADFSYPYAVEHEGKLYIGYTHKSHAANELAVIPINQLRVDDVRRLQVDVPSKRE